jgi:hypothetical protein
VHRTLTVQLGSSIGIFILPHDRLVDYLIEQIEGAR